MTLQVMEAQRRLSTESLQNSIYHDIYLPHSRNQQMATVSRYFSRAPLRGVGKLHFLIVPQAAPKDSGAETLLGSLVAEYDRGVSG
jgi:hypothetical protein